jgi:hypothetical protein
MASIDPYNISEVDIRVIKSVYVPCKSCHWYNVCTVPKGKYMPKFKEYVGDSSIHYNNRYSGREEGGSTQIVYHCLEYTTLKRNQPRGY